MLVSVLSYSAPPGNLIVACSLGSNKELTLFWSFMNIFKYSHTFIKLRHSEHNNKFITNTIIFEKKCVSYYIRHYLKKDYSNHQWRTTAKILCLLSFHIFILLLSKYVWMIICVYECSYKHTCLCIQTQQYVFEDIFYFL